MAKAKAHFGAFYPAESVMHRLDPRTKLIGLIFYLVAVFAADSFYLFALIYAFGLAMVYLSRVPLKRVLRSVRTIVVLLILTGILNAFFTAGENIIWQWGVLKLTEEGVVWAALMVLRLVALIAFSSILTLTTTPIALADAMETLCRPLRRLHFPVHEFAMMMSIALRFIPLLLEESDKIMKAQRSRGGDWNSGSLSQRLKGIVAIIIPLFFGALKRAEDLAVAMEARAYHGDAGRSRLRELKWQKRDTAGLIVAAVFMALIFGLRWFVPVV